MVTAQEGISVSFVELVREVHHRHYAKGEDLAICEFCFARVSKVTKYPKDPMVGKVCQDCTSDLDKSLTLPTATAAPKRVKDPNAAPADPKKTGVITWIQELIFRDEKIHVAKLKGLLEDKGYKPATLNAQMARMKKCYYFSHDFVYLSKEVAEKDGGKK